MSGVMDISVSNSVETSMIPKSLIDSLEFSKLDESTQNEVLKCKSLLNINNPQSIMTYGQEACKSIANFNKTLLSQFKLKDIPEIEELLPMLTNAFKEVDTGTLRPKKKSGLFGRFFKKDEIGAFIQKFENVEQVVQGVQKKLQQVNFQLLQDIETETLLGKQSLNYIKQLDCHIFAIKLQYKEELEKITREEEMIDRSDIVAMHLLAERKELVARLDRKAYRLQTQRVEAIQSLPIIKEIINGNIGLSEQIESAITQGIPTWERNILIALQLYRQQGALKIEQSVHKMTNDLIKKNSLLLKKNATSIAQAVENGLIDIETLEEANKNIIETTAAITKIADEATRKRQENIIKLDKLVAELVNSETRSVLGSSVRIGSGE